MFTAHLLHACCSWSLHKVDSFFAKQTRKSWESISSSCPSKLLINIWTYWVDVIVNDAVTQGPKGPNPLFVDSYPAC